MKSLRQILGREQGVALVLVVLVGAFLSLLAITLIDVVGNESTRSAHAMWRQSSFQAAEAGIDDYMAKLVDDRLYYAHHTHPAESTRQTSGGINVPPDSNWATGYGLTWTYPNGEDNWQPLGNGYEYNLQITPSNASNLAVQIVSTGRKVGATTDERAIETLVRPSSLADFYRLVHGNVSWGSGATTNGKIYAGGNVTHDGTATANIYAEGQITGSTTLQNGAKKYDSDSSPNIRSQIKNPINFSSFLASFTDIQRAATLGGNLFTGAPAGWKLVFKNNGTFDATPCSLTSGKALDDTAPTCPSAQTANYPIPANGAIYTNESAVVSGQVKGRVTLASNDDIIIADAISPVTPGQDVIGLVTKNDLYVAKYAPNVLTWSAAVLVQTDTWQGSPTAADDSHSTMNFTGSSATYNGGDFAMFTTRNYNYDSTLLYLPPPWFPSVDDTYTIVSFRELPAS